MARKPFIAGNWKMNTTLAEAGRLACRLVQEIGAVTEADLAVFPPFTHLSLVGSALQGSRLALGAQDLFYENDGAFTGEVSGRMLRDVGCRCVLAGHSERRHVIGETDEVVNRKVLKALADGLEPIFCVGELLEERQAGRTFEVVARQVRIGLEGVDRAHAEKVTIAYEPVWAIGTGLTASPQQAQEVHARIRSLVAQRYDAELASRMRIQYGGSVKPANAGELMRQPDVDGLLVGGASLKAEDFAAIVRAGLECL